MDSSVAIAAVPTRMPSMMFRATHNTAEGAGAAGLAAALQERSRLAGKKAAFVQSGGNVDSDVFARILAATA